MSGWKIKHQLIHDTHRSIDFRDVVAKDRQRGGEMMGGYACLQIKVSDVWVCCTRKENPRAGSGDGQLSYN